ncbi:MAG: AAA family ATPase [Prevotellaceae bacterium]|jgi:hypothetical protein|nr:AAA family ATPase [Prevotellaceae bacterium]
MMSAIRKLPVGIQDFEDLRTSGYLYVDKTEYIYSVTAMEKPYLPECLRRFGKSLPLSTLKEFNCKKQGGIKSMDKRANIINNI